MSIDIHNISFEPLPDGSDVLVTLGTSNDLLFLLSKVTGMFCKEGANLFMIPVDISLESGNLRVTIQSIAYDSLVEKVACLSIKRSEANKTHLTIRIASFYSFHRRPAAAANLEGLNGKHFDCTGIG